MKNVLIICFGIVLTFGVVFFSGCNPFVPGSRWAWDPEGYEYAPLNDDSVWLYAYTQKVKTAPSLIAGPNTAPPTEATATLVLTINGTQEESSSKYQLAYTNAGSGIVRYYIIKDWQNGLRVGKQEQNYVYTSGKTQYTTKTVTTFDPALTILKFPLKVNTTWTSTSTVKTSSTTTSTVASSPKTAVFTNDSDSYAINVTFTAVSKGQYSVKAGKYDDVLEVQIVDNTDTNDSTKTGKSYWAPSVGLLYWENSTFKMELFSKTIK